MVNAFKRRLGRHARFDKVELLLIDEFTERDLKVLLRLVGQAEVAGRRAGKHVLDHYFRALFERAGDMVHADIFDEELHNVVFFL